MSSKAQHSNITILILQLITDQKLRTAPIWSSDLFLPSPNNSLDQLQQFLQSTRKFVIFSVYMNATMICWHKILTISTELPLLETEGLGRQGSYPSIAALAESP